MTNPIVQHTPITHPGASPTSWMLLLHGVFGMGSNLRTLAKMVMAKRPDWGFVLVDLRGHGASQGFEGPHSVAAAAGDLAVLVGSLSIEIKGVTGHSFGGKVALSLLELRTFEAENVISLDSLPGGHPGSGTVEDVANILGFLESVPQPMPSREAFVELARGEGISKPTSDWLAMNVRRTDDGFRLRLDLPAIRTMMADYRELDLWYVVEDPSLAKRVDLVVGGASRQYSPSDLERARSIEKSHPHVHVALLPKAGHWLHTDDPEGLADVVANALAPS